jgi:hypothetical protein
MVFSNPVTRSLQHENLKNLSVCTANINDNEKTGNGTFVPAQAGLRRREIF